MHTVIQINACCMMLWCMGVEVTFQCSCSLWLGLSLSWKSRSRSGKWIRSHPACIGKRRFIQFYCICYNHNYYKTMELYIPTVSLPHACTHSWSVLLYLDEKRQVLPEHFVGNNVHSCFLHSESQEECSYDEVRYKCCNTSAGGGEETTHSVFLSCVITLTPVEHLTYTRISTSPM